MLQQFLSRLVSFRQISPKLSSDKNNDSESTDYNPELITNLINEHKDIIEISNSIKNLAQKREWDLAQEQLKYLSKLITMHMNAETVTLYRILEHIHTPNSLEVEMIKFIRQEMTSVGIDLINFIKKYNSIESEQWDKRVFIYEYNKLLYTLTARIELEENTLYPLYEILLNQKK
ncbi:hemerythrin domain-containing protein [Wohlfahrtiimonas larvae]|nr:hemerythrin domain-containing protein [Wohlfahrtiimonas larvae]